MQGQTADHPIQRRPGVNIRCEDAHVDLWKDFTAHWGADPIRTKSHTSAIVEPTAFAGCDAVTAGKRQASLASNSWRSHTCRGGGTKARDRVEDRRLAARARYPAPAVGLPPWYRFATNGLLLRYIAGGGERYTN